MSQNDTKLTESKMAELPISDELYEMLERLGAEKGMTPDDFARKLLDGVLKGLKFKTLTTIEDKEES